MTRHIATALQLLILLLPATLMAQEATPAAAQTDSLIWASVDSLSVFNLDEVVVTGTGTNYLLKNAPVQTEIINAKTLESYGSASLTEILSGLIPSIDFSHSDMGTAMQMGGLSSQYILILLNGKRLMSDLGGQTNLDMIDPTRIERIEVVKGAASALYGSDAIAGVINIITKKSRDNLSIDNSTRVASYGVVNQSNAFQYKAGDWTTLTDFNLKHSDGWQNTTCEDPNRYEYPITNSVNNTSNPYLDWQIGQHLYWRQGKPLSAYVEGNYYRKDIHRPTGVPDYKTYDFRYHNTSAGAGMRWQTPQGAVLTAQMQYYMHAYYYVYTGETWAKEFLPDGKEFSFPYFPGDVGLQSNQQRITTQLKGVFSLPFDQRLSAGLDLHHNWLIAPHRLDEERVDDFQAGLYLQDEWTPTKSFNLTAGARLTYHPAFGAKFTPKVSLLYKLGPVNLRATYSEGFKTPTIKELHYRYIRQMALIILHLGNPNLKAQTSRYVSGSVEYHSPMVNVSVTGYGNFLNHMITLVTIPSREAPGDLIATYRPARVRQYKNMDSAKTYGADVTAKWRIHKQWTLTTSYSYLDTEALLYDDEKQEMRQVTIDGMAHHRATLGLSWSEAFLHQRYKLAVGLYGRMQSTRYYQDDGNGKPYHLWRLNTQQTIIPNENWSLDLNIGVDNLLNYYETTYHGLHYGTSTPGRTLYLNLSLHFGRAKQITPTKRSSHRLRSQEDEED